MSRESVLTKGPPRDLAGVLAPLGPEEFFSSYWEKQFGHFRGWPGKFAGLLPWQRVNEILSQHRLDSTRLRLVKEGKPLPVETYLEYDASARDPFQRIPCLKLDGMTESLQKGATLVLDAVDELHAPLTRLVESLQRSFRINIQVNAYATWRQDRGFDLHWDDHDVMILQVAGRKRWTLFGPSRLYPLRQDVEPNRTPPTEPIWESLLSDGDALYIPRGWWHVAVPLEEPTLHLTVNFVNPTGHDFLRWLVDKARAREIVRRDLPRFAGPEARADHMKVVREELLSVWDENSVDSYLQDLESEMVLRPHPSLPWSATSEGIPPDDQARVVLALPLLNMARDEALRAIRVRCGGKDWVLFEDAEPLLEALGDARPHSIRELCERLEERIEPARIRGLLKELVLRGVLEIVPEER